MIVRLELNLIEQHAQAGDGEPSPRTTKLYDRPGDELSLDEYERVGI